MDRLKAHDFAFPYRHIIGEGAGHLIDVPYVDRSSGDLRGRRRPAGERAGRRDDVAGRAWSTSQRCDRCRPERHAVARSPQPRAVAAFGDRPHPSRRCPRARPGRRSPVIPVGAPPSHAPRFLLLNAIFPGLGHLAAGRWKWALLLGGPLLILLLALVAPRGDERPDRARGPAVRPGGADDDPRRRGRSSSAGGCSRSARLASSRRSRRARRPSPRSRSRRAHRPRAPARHRRPDGRCPRRGRPRCSPRSPRAARGCPPRPRRRSRPTTPTSPSTRPPLPRGRSSPAPPHGHAGGAARERAADRHGLGRRPDDGAHRHDDHRLARPGREDGLDGVDPARHGRRAPARRAQVPRQDQRARQLRPLAPEQVPGLEGRPVGADRRAGDAGRDEDRLLGAGQPAAGSSRSSTRSAA